MLKLAFYTPVLTDT